ncbi:MAG: hypothetical protein KDD92_02740 [Caldilineaceae bacterium]|nr:hypothetical protein [Caldilineaceae bacterium]
MDYAEMALEELLALEYDLTSAVERLAQQPYIEVGTELLSAQDQLYAVEKARSRAEQIERTAQAETETTGEIVEEAGEEAASPQDAGPTKVMRGGKTRRSLGGEQIKERVRGMTDEVSIEYTINLPRVPTSVYNLLDVTEEPLLYCEFTRTDGAAFGGATFGSSARRDGSRRTFMNDSSRRYRVRSFIQHFSSDAVNIVTLEPGETVTVRQLPTLLPDRVAQINELTRATLHIIIERQKAADSPEWLLETHVTEPIWLLAKTSAPQASLDPRTGKWTDLTRYMGAFVTPNTPAVIGFLRTVADGHPDKQLSGYQGDVRSQVEAIYTALRQSGMIYVNSVMDFNPGRRAQSQRVRLPSESLSQRMANCIDGVVLMASLIQGISVNPCIVVLPRHALVGWETGPQSDTWEYVETTMLATHDFETAVKVGNSRVATHQKRFEDTGDPAWYRRWSLRDLRTIYGIMPLE